MLDLVNLGHTFFLPMPPMQPAPLCHAAGSCSRPHRSFRYTPAPPSTKVGQRCLARAGRRSVYAFDSAPGGTQQGQAGPDPSAEDGANSLKSEPAGPGPGSSGRILAGAAVGFGAALFLFTRLAGGGPSWAAFERAATPIDIALSNGKPTVVELYATWCEVCRELLPDTYEVEQQYKDKVNFVALNIDNAKWTPEMIQYGVRGIPHYVFLDSSGRQQAAAVGRLPREVLEGNTQALAQGKPLPFSRARGATSSLDQKSAPPRSTQPRDHA